MPYQRLLQHALSASAKVQPPAHHRRLRQLPTQPPLLALALRFARLQSWRLRRLGQPLSPFQCRLARQMGVQTPERVRLLWSRQLPRPYPLPLRCTLAKLGLTSELLWGFTLGYGIVLHPDAWGDPAILAHELVHVAQYERLGFETFTHVYLQALLQHGYEQHPLEREAERLARRICHRLDPAPSLFCN